MMLKIEQLIELKPLIEGLYKVLDELAAKDGELVDVKAIARRLSDEHSETLKANNNLQLEVNALKSFIVDHVPEDKHKLIFK